MTDPDRDLARRARRGDRQALTRLYERHGAGLFGFLVRTTGRRAIAEDVFQEAWMKVVQRIDRFEPSRGTFRAWLYRIATNAAVDRARRDAVRRTADLDAPLDEDGTAWVDLVEGLEPGPDRAGTSRLLGEAIARALATLNPNQRAAVLLRHQQEMSYEEIARALDVAEGTAKSMVHRGVARLREQLSEWIDDRHPM